MPLPFILDMKKSSSASCPRPDELHRKVIATFPDLADVSYRYSEEGWDHQVLLYEAAGKVFRFPRTDEYRAVLPCEHDVLRAIEPLVDIAIPQPFYLAPDGAWAGYSYVEGNQLFADYFRSLPGRERQSIAQQLADFMSVIHRLDRQQYPVLRCVSITSLAQDQLEMKDLICRHLTGQLTVEDQQIADNVMKEIDGILLTDLPAVFTHTDIYNAHLFWNRPTQQLGLIDFADMSIGDPAFDFAELYEYGEDFVAEIYDRYTGPKDVTLLERARVYWVWVGLYMMVDHFLTHKTSFEEARQTFDLAKKIYLGHSTGQQAS